MGAVVLADPGDGARAGSWRRFALPTLLILGWVGLFAYSAAYLTEDLPFRPSMPEAGPSAGSSAGPRAARRVVMLDEPDQPAPPAEAPGQTAMAAAAAPPRMR
ncbi:peptidase inhibitor family I36 protein, partial [Methylobacterium organophilum]|nr:peptidase inhibitor family I36 protein [Methylobacterium organophilum]